MTAKKRPIRERGRPIWVSAPVGRKLDERLAARTEELQRQVTMSEVVEQLLTQAEERAS